MPRYIDADENQYTILNKTGIEKQGVWEDVLTKVSSAQPEVIEKVIKEYCRDRCLCLVDSVLLKKYTFTQPEPIRINLNEWIKVKLTDWGKEIYYHQYDRINQIAGRKVCKPKFPKEDENGYTKFQLWCFIELYGEHMGITLPNIIEPLEIVYERNE